MRRIGNVYGTQVKGDLAFALRKAKATLAVCERGEGPN